MSSQQHITVLLTEVVDALALEPDAIVVDGTFGGGGHANEILKQLSAKGTYIGIDADDSALDRSELNESKAKIHLINDNFGNVAEILKSLNIEEVDALTADLGWRMEQFADGNKGFSFSHDGPLHMTFGNPSKYPFTAHDIVNEWEEHVIADILYGYAQERFARRIAKKIVEVRENEIIDTTFKLVSVVESALPRFSKKSKINPATKTFQALRIAVNDELGVLEKFIKEGFHLLKPGGKMAIITFHSIEDRVVKHSFRELKEADLGELTPKKPIAPSDEEVQQNPRARSAKLRVITKT